MNLSRAPLSMHAELMLQALLSLLVRTWKRHTDWSHPRIDINQELEWCLKNHPKPLQGTVHIYPSIPHLNNITKPNLTSLTTSRQRKVGPVRCHLLTYHLQERLCIWPCWILLSNLPPPLGISEKKNKVCRIQTKTPRERRLSCHELPSLRIWNLEVMQYTATKDAQCTTQNQRQIRRVAHFDWMSSSITVLCFLDYAKFGEKPAPQCSAQTKKGCVHLDIVITVQEVW